ncbi:MAG: glycoside hydrolase family 5 protein [Proteobacteria bacterium]|nr:glycoside hydrolase family 5 protein [Pseudomonadota bacterium]
MIRALIASTCFVVFAASTYACRHQGASADQAAIASTSSSCIGSDGRIKTGYDRIGSHCVDRAESFYVQGGEIYNRGKKILIKGVNWFGLEGASLDPSGQTHTHIKLGGLWTGRSMESFVDDMAALGFNAWRIPLSPEALDPATAAFDTFATIPQEIEHFLSYTESKGMLVLLDLHNCGKDHYFKDKPGPGVSGSGCATYTEDKWKKDLKALATIAKAHPNVIGIDLFNEPFGLSWTDWLGMTSRAADAVLQTNPTILVFMEGVGSIGTSSTAVFWGENLFEAATNVPNIPQSRLVFSPHVYGPSVSKQSYFSVAGFPTNMPAIWDEHFGYLKNQGYCLAIGEFGGKYVDQDKIWGDTFVAYIQNRKLDHFFYWAMNQNAEDTGGLYTDTNWKALNQEKLNMLRPLLERK